MKLRNKKTGETAEASILNFELVVRYNDGRVEKYPLLFDYSNFEYYKEPKGIVKVEKSIVPTCVHIEYSTEEEAEEAVKKFKAWKRLKDKGFRFDGVEIFNEGLLEIDGVLPALGRVDNAERLKIIENLDLLFSGEDD